MRFTHQALHGLGDAQQNFEQLESLAILDRTPAFGVVTVTWAGGNQFTATVSPAHGLGRTPVAVLLTTESPLVACWAQLVAASDATSIHLNAQAPALPVAGTTALVHWLAIG